MTISINSITFLIGILSPYSIHAVGDLYIAELLLLIIFGIMLRKPKFVVLLSPVVLYCPVRGNSGGYLEVTGFSRRSVASFSQKKKC